MTLETQRQDVRDKYRAARAARKDLTAALRRRTPHAKLTVALVALNVIVFVAIAIHFGRVAAFPSAVLIRWGAGYGPRTADGEWWRLLPAIFLHVNPLHLAFNMIALLMAGPLVERLVGARAFLLFYLGSGLVGAAASLLVHPLTASVGASGAIMGLYGVLLLMMFERSQGVRSARDAAVAPLARRELQIHLQPAVSAILSTLILGLLDARADNAAHAGGLVAGCLFGWMGGRHIESFLPSRRVAAAALALAVGCCAVSLAAQRDVNDIRPAMSSVFETDSRALALYSKTAAAHADANTISRLIETEIIPAFARERARLASSRQVPREQRRILADLQEYVMLREEFWRQRAASAGSKDEEARRGVEAADSAADTVMRRLLEVR